MKRIEKHTALISDKFDFMKIIINMAWLLKTQKIVLKTLKLTQSHGHANLSFYDLLHSDITLAEPKGKGRLVPGNN